MKKSKLKNKILLHSLDAVDHSQKKTEGSYYDSAVKVITDLGETVGKALKCHDGSIWRITTIHDGRQPFATLRVP